MKTPAQEIAELIMEMSKRGEITGLMLSKFHNEYTVHFSIPIIKKQLTYDNVLEFLSEPHEDLLRNFESTFHNESTNKGDTFSPKTKRNIDI